MMRNKEMSPRDPITFSSIWRDIRGQKFQMALHLSHARYNAKTQMELKGRMYQGIVSDSRPKTRAQSELPIERGDSSRSKELPGLER